ncbi:FUSC family protein [Acinetobacter nectaris]|uniref:FUSC family protein n=1 Tax=Acinetobacter nectaris TaxID=1219382 RepID=UPI001F164806|nr:FUSC family protein [Acinetobacter nectaris]MCF9000097.1 FUSC family protein [Acinetobacter nectaris]MCF9027151.1 FUSC family protein [Acinetobacter nectaris]
MQLIKQLLAFRPSRLDLIFAIKTYIAAMLALYISFSLDLLNPMWSIGTVIIVSNPFSGMVSSKALYRLAGTTIGAIIAIILMPNLINTPWLFAFVVAGWVGFCLYISLLDRTPRSYMLMLSGYTVAMIVFNSINNIDTHNIFDIALARFLEIAIAVICTAVVSAVVFPMHIGPVIQQRVNKNLVSIEELFSQILKNEIEKNNYTQALASVTRDMSEIHVLAVHLWYEKSKLKGMTKPLQEMLHQLSMAVANLVAMSERLKQLDLHNEQFTQTLNEISLLVINFLKSHEQCNETNILALPTEFDEKFECLMQQLTPEQKTVLYSFKMDVRHYIQNVRIVKFIWEKVQRGEKKFPEYIVPLTTKYPSLHRDQGVAVRGGLAATLSTFLGIAIWILSGWKAGYMLAQMAAVCACILTAIDNPVPALKIFLWGSVISSVIVFIYAFGIFPNITEFWELAVVLAPTLIFFALLISTPSLMALGLVLGVTSVMAMNLQNRYAMDAVAFLEASFGMILGVLCALISIYFIRAMSPEKTASRILAKHYKAMREALYIPYGTKFRIHLRSMMDRIGVLNTKLVQSENLKVAMNWALIETSAVVDFARLEELASSRKLSTSLHHAIGNLQQTLDETFRELEETLTIGHQTQTKLMELLSQIEQLANENDDVIIRQRVKSSLNNIRNSILHADASHQIHVGEVMA